MKKYLDSTINYFKNKYHKAKEYLLSSENRRKNLTTILLLIVLHLVLLIASSAAYYNDTVGIPLIHATIGDLDAEKYDYVLKIFIQDINNNGNKTYHLVNSIPTYNYKYSSYNCKNNSSFLYDDINKVTSVTMDKKDVCSIYFDLESAADIIVNIYIQDNEDSSKYVKVDNILNNINYKLNNENSNCLDIDGNIQDIEINYSNGVIDINTTSKSYCDIYLDVANE